MRKRKMNRALVVALSVAMASSNIAPTVTYAAESSQIFEASEQENPQEETSEHESDKTEYNFPLQVCTLNTFLL